MEYEVIHLGPKLLMGTEIRTSNKDAMKDLPGFWGSFWRDGIQAKIPGKKSEDVYGLYCEYETDYTGPYTLVAGCEVKMTAETPAGLVAKKIPASKYAVFEIEGKFPAAMMEVWKWVWEGHLRRTYTGDFELYPTGWHPEENTKMQIYIAIS